MVSSENDPVTFSPLTRYIYLDIFFMFNYTVTEISDLQLVMI